MLKDLTVTQGQLQLQRHWNLKCLYYLQTRMLLNFLANLGEDYIFLKPFFLLLAVSQKPPERTPTSIKAEQWYSLRGNLAAETTIRASVICTETYAKREYTWSQCGRMSIFVHVYSVRFKCLLNVLEGFSDSETLGAGRLDINIYMQNLHLLYLRLSSSSGELCREPCVNTGMHPRGNILGLRSVLQKHGRSNCEH